VPARRSLGSRGKQRAPRVYVSKHTASGEHASQQFATLAKTANARHKAETFLRDHKVVQIESLQSLALSVAQARSPESVLREMVEGLGRNDGVALARVWLIERDEHGVASLILKASVGQSIADADVRWDETTGNHAKVAINYGKIGRIAQTSTPLLLQRGNGDWLLQREWADIEKIEAFAGQPLCFKGEVLGVVAVFSRNRIERRELGWLRVFADHAAVAIANARAFEEIEALKERLESERDYLRQAVRDALHPGAMVAESPVMQQLMREVRAIAGTDGSVLIQGESGVGKELFASAIHDMSARANGPLVKVNCASIPRELFESEFFGHVRGAFSGASRNREGRFALAEGGTLFLDEVGEIPYELQGKLLRVLQERTFEPVGDDRTRVVNVRVVAATNSDLERDIERGRFRLDLFYRLSMFPLYVPPLRERRQDIVPLARQFLKSASQKLNASAPELSPSDERALLEYDFPGNIRELQNVIERAVVLFQTDRGTLDLQLTRRRFHSTAPAPLPPRKPDTEAPARLSSEGIIPAADFRELERRNILAALDKCAWRVAGERGAAKLLGIPASTLTYQMKTLGIERRSGS
jgi:transcriptional regulator with GAF, ATPase, and Fis domain